jgi:hypothetical protein
MQDMDAKQINNCTTTEKTAFTNQPVGSKPEHLQIGKVFQTSDAGDFVILDPELSKVSTAV